jgi:hypothetical protein
VSTSIPFGLLVFLATELVTSSLGQPFDGMPPAVRTVLENTRPLEIPRAKRLPLFILPISQSLATVNDTIAEAALRELDRRGIAYTVAWNPSDFTNSVREAIRIGRLQQRLGMEVAVDATSCLMSFYDGTDAMLHVDENGRPFADTSFGGRLGCPFTLPPRIPVIAARVESFVREYQLAGLTLNFACADWEVDGPIEWNGAWEASQKCRRCREAMPNIGDFREFQRRLRAIRSGLEREAFALPLRRAYPKVLVGNYGVHPHEGYRYWYDYYEKEVPAEARIPFKADQRARYREWAHEFAGSKFTFANPVLYTWYRLFNWYDFKDPDYRWFYNLLLEGSSAGQSTPVSTPLIPFVHWTTTDPPKSPDPNVRQFTAAKYQELLWHLLLRGHDSFFLWCMPNELAAETRLLHPVYAESLAYREFLDHGQPISFEVPAEPAPVISGLRLGDRVLVRRTEFGDDKVAKTVHLADGGTILVPLTNRLQIVSVQPPAQEAGFLHAHRKVRFPLGFYELPKSDDDLRAMAQAGVNLVQCRNRADLDRALAAGLLGWIPIPIQDGPSESLRSEVKDVATHPALAAWEGPDEIVWNFTANSGLERTAGFTRNDWRRQSPTATAYAAEQAKHLLPKLQAGIHLVRELDPAHRPFWINEAADSDVAYARSYIDTIDITGCDYYPVRSTGTDLATVGQLVDRWKAIGRDKPVWMVLQAFSWHSLTSERSKRYPTFDESRFMAYDALVHGARGLLYWGSWMIEEPPFRQSLYRLTTELAGIEDFLVGEELSGVSVRCIADVPNQPSHAVRCLVKRSANEYILILVNEDTQPHLGVEVTGLESLEGRTLTRLSQASGPPLRVERGTIVARLQGQEVQRLSTAGKQPASNEHPAVEQGPGNQRERQP